MFKYMIILVLSIGLIQYTNAVCNQCSESGGAACISEKEFHLCFQGIPDTSITYKCLGENDICTKFGPVCMSTIDTTAKPACGVTSHCGKCEADAKGTFACTSRTTFGMCFEGDLSDMRMKCPEKQICDVNLGKEGKIPCVPSCMETKPDTLMCDLKDDVDEPVTTTVASATTTALTITTEEIPVSTITDKVVTTTIEAEEGTTTTIFAPTPPPLTTTTEKESTITELPTTTQNPAELVCSQQTAAGRYPYPNDSTCKNYIYCYLKGGVMETTFMKCPSQLYFNPSTSLCGEVKPQGCI